MESQPKRKRKKENPWASPFTRHGRGGASVLPPVFSPDILCPFDLE